MRLTSIVNGSRGTIERSAAVAPASRREVCVVIPTYRPDEEFPSRVEEIRRQVGYVIIVDDGECTENVHKLNQWFGKLPDIMIQHNLSNAGIAASLNRGISLARERGYTWILTLDDDSMAEPGMVESLMDGLARVTSSKPLGIIGMSWREPGHSPQAKRGGDEAFFAEKRGIITSGSLFSLDTYDAVGPFREEFYIDLVDYDYCLRARAKGFSVVQLSQIGFTHSLGHRKVFQLMGIRVAVRIHEPFRIYYVVRNSTILAFDYCMKDPLYSIACFVGTFNLVLKIILFERDKILRLIEALRGLSDGVLLKTGKRG